MKRMKRMKQLILVVTTILALISCAQKEDSEMNVPKAGSEDFSLIMDAEDPVVEVERRLKVAIAQQENDAFSPNDITVDEISEEEKDEANNDVLAYYSIGIPDIYFALEATNEFSLTIVNEEAAESLGDDLHDFINIFVRTADPTLNLEEGSQAATQATHLSNTKHDYGFFQTDFVSIEYSINGFIPYSETHFTDEVSEETLFYSSIPLSELPNEQ